MLNKKQSKILFEQFKKEYFNLKTIEEFKQAKRDYMIVSNQFGIYKDTVSRFIELKELEFKNNSLNSLIRPFEELKPLKFNLKGLDSLNMKIDKLNDLKLKFEFKGLFNLLSDSSNLVYNPLYTRQQIIKDLNKFKSLKFFKVSYISRYDLKREYKHLTYKNGAVQGHSKIYFIENGLYVMKSLKKDDITLKVFYVGHKYKTLLRKTNYKRVLKGDKYNISCLNAYKVLNKQDSIKYYTYCNDNCLDKKNRQLLRSIRKSKRLSKDSLIDLLEDRRSEILENMKISSEIDILYYELELEDIEQKLQELKTLEEDNSLENETFLSDYF